jgi:hypothetical protein
MKTRLFNGAVLASAATAAMAAAGQSIQTVAAKTMVGCIEKSESGPPMLTPAVEPVDSLKMIAASCSQ